LPRAALFDSGDRRVDITEWKSWRISPWPVAGQRRRSALLPRYFERTVLRALIAIDNRSAHYQVLDHRDQPR